MSAPARSYRHAAAWVWFAFFALLPRVLVPAGTMPQFDAGFDVPLAFCTSSGIEFRNAPWQRPAPTEDHGTQSTHDCPFGSLSSGALTGLSTPPVAFTALFGSLLLPVIDRVAARAALAAHRARAPPLTHS